MDQNYITILIQSLEKKIRVLEEISRENQNQKEILKKDEMDMDDFRASIDKKNQLIGQISFLDEGFEQMYQRVKDTLHVQKQNYQQEIAVLKRLISQITEKTVSIQKEELENKNLAEAQFGNTRKQIRQVKNNSQVAAKYYKSMSKLNYVDPQFMDKKK